MQGDDMLKNIAVAKTDKIHPSIPRSIGVLVVQIFAVVWTYRLLSNTDWNFLLASLACLATYVAIGEVNIKHIPNEKMLAVIRVIHLLFFIAVMLFFSISMSNAVKVLTHPAGTL
jgi:dipeptide/tripeptide permease